MKDQNEEQKIEEFLKILAKSSLIVFITLFLSKIFLYLYRIIIARYYGPGVYGLFVLSVMLLTWFRIFASFGFREGLLRYISVFRGRKEKEKIPHIFKISIVFSMSASILAGFLLFFFSDFIALRIFSNSDLVIFLKIFSVVLPFVILGGIFLAVIRAFEKVGWYSFISNVLWNSATLLALVVLIFFGINSVSVPVSYLIGTFLMFAASYYVCRTRISEIFNSGKKITDAKSKKIFREVFSYSWPFIFYGVVVSVFYWIDSFMIGIFKTVSDVGFYNVAVPIASLLVLPLDLFRQLFFPLVTKEYSKGNFETVRQLSQQVGKWIFMMSMPFFVLLMIFPGAFIRILFGTEFLVAENALRFLSVGALFTALFGVSEDLISMKGKSKLVLIDVSVTAVINIILNYIFVPLYGISGAGFATMISMIVLNLLFLFQSYKNLSIIPVRRKILRVTFVIVFSTLLLLIVRHFVRGDLLSLIICGVFFFAVYTFLILTTNCLDKNDWNILKAIFIKLKLKKPELNTKTIIQ
jgi:O-antigen/teichoic acid export membrane protein